MAMRILAILAVAGIAGASEAHPVGKVINLLNKLKDQAIEEGKNEEVLFAKFSYWCKVSTSDLKKAIAEEKATIDELESSIKGFKQEKKGLEGQIKEIEGEEKALKLSAKDAKNKDSKRHKAYLETKTDLKNTIKSIGDAVAAMEGASKTDSGLLQEGARSSVSDVLAFLSMKATDEQQNMLVDFVSAKPRPDQLVKGDEKKHVKKYAFKSDNVIDLLKELKLKFEDDYTELTKDETSSLNGYTLEKEARDNAEKAADKSKKNKQGILAETTSSLAEADGNLKDQQADLAADSKSFDKTDESCKTKTREWEERSKTRSGEIEAIEVAAKILAKVSGVRTGAPSNPVLPSSPVDFLQIMNMDPKAKAVQLLRATAKTVHSKALEQLALEVSTHLTGPFDKVNDMIQKMVFRLMAEQTDEDKHKAWCDLELDKTKKSMEDKTDKIKDLNAKVKSENAKVAQITSDITTAQKMIADITAFMAESIEIRTAGKKENTISIKESKQAQTAIANAVAVLEDFYKSSGQVKKESYEFIQKGPVKLPKDPKLWDSGYTGVADPKKQDTGVITILETVAADFSKMEAETKAQEVEDQKKFDDSQKAHKIEKARRQQESDTKTQEKKRKISKIESMTKQKKHASEELEAVEKYNTDLQPTCVKGDSSFADRKAARAKEIKALKEAQGLLQTAFKKKGASFLQLK